MATKAIQSLYTEKEMKQIEVFIDSKKTDPSISISKSNLQRVALLKYISKK